MVRHRTVLPMLVLWVPATAFALNDAADPPEAPEDPRRSIAVQFGLLQPIVLRGGNIEADFRWDRLVISYSHGWSLQIPRSGVTQEQHLRQYIPFTTGLGIGAQYYFESIGLSTDLRAELKYHRFEFSLEDGTGNVRRPLVEYDTITAGAGLYATWLPFHSSQRTVRGLDIGANVRAWPRVWSTLDGNRLEYYNGTTGQDEVHETADIGIANSPILVNVSVGYLFPF